MGRCLLRSLLLLVLAAGAARGQASPILVQPTATVGAQAFLLNRGPLMISLLVVIDVETKALIGMRGGIPPVQVGGRRALAFATCGRKGLMWIVFYDNGPTTLKFFTVPV